MNSTAIAAAIKIKNLAKLRIIPAIVPLSAKLPPTVAALENTGQSPPHTSGSKAPFPAPALRGVIFRPGVLGVLLTAAQEGTKTPSVHSSAEAFIFDNPATNRVAKSEKTERVLIIDLIVENI